MWPGALVTWLFFLKQSWFSGNGPILEMLAFHLLNGDFFPLNHDYEDYTPEV